MSKKKVRKVTAALANKKAPKKPAVKKKAATKKPSRKKADNYTRKKIIWGVFNSSMKEEGRFPYDQRDEAVKKLEQLQSKSKKPYFLQAIKEVLSTEAGSKVKKPQVDSEDAIVDEEDAVVAEEE